MSLLMSPLVGFFCRRAAAPGHEAAIRNKALYEEPKGNKPPPCGSAAC
jgi:PiT family inorganic phosphate transporter